MKHIKYAKLVPLGDRFHIVQSTGILFFFFFKKLLSGAPLFTLFTSGHHGLVLVSPPEIKPLHYKTIVQTPAICSNIHPLSSTNRLTLSQQLTFKPKGNLQSPVNLTTLTACPWEIARVPGRTHAHTGRMH